MLERLQCVLTQYPGQRMSGAGIQAVEGTAQHVTPTYRQDMGNTRYAQSEYCKSHGCVLSRRRIAPVDMLQGVKTNALALS